MECKNRHTVFIMKIAIKQSLVSVQIIGLYNLHIPVIYKFLYSIYFDTQVFTVIHFFVCFSCELTHVIMVCGFLENILSLIIPQKNKSIMVISGDCIGPCWPIHLCDYSLLRNSCTVTAQWGGAPSSYEQKSSLSYCSCNCVPYHVKIQAVGNHCIAKDRYNDLFT